jgi:hypothetical protein
MELGYAIAVGFALGAGLAVSTIQTPPSTPGSTSVPARQILAIGIVAIVAILATFTPLGAGSSVVTVTIGLPVTGIVLAVSRIAAKDHPWPVWVGLALCVVPALFWTAFLLSQILGPVR